MGAGGGTDGAAGGRTRSPFGRLAGCCCCCNANKSCGRLDEFNAALCCAVINLNHNKTKPSIKKLHQIRITFFRTGRMNEKKVGTYRRVPAAEGGSGRLSVTGPPMVAPPLCNRMLSMLARAVFVLALTTSCCWATATSTMVVATSPVCGCPIGRTAGGC